MFREIEKKWQKHWDDNQTFKTENNSDLEKFYYLIEFPYPSGAGLHVGHVRSYTALDAMARKKRMQGFNVLYPIGWDAFGLPTEQYAIKNKIHPTKATEENIAVFKKQIKDLGISFDWDREFSTTDPEYYKWTQWQFLKFVEHNMAYKEKKEINWCPNCKIGLSNEEAEGNVCERCGGDVVKKEKEQWILKMSEYSEKLLQGLEETEFLDRIKTAQVNWIGKSTGALVDFKLTVDETLQVFTTRPDTLFGVTFMVISPEHKLLSNYSDLITNMNEIKEYQTLAAKKTEIERTDATKEKTGVKIEGIKAINPVTNKEIEIWISDYVLANYGTGAIMAVPAHDQRDYEFAKKFNIEIVQVLAEETGVAHANEDYKESIVAVVYDPKEKKYLTINWNNLGGRLFIGGTRKNNEPVIDCALREIEEETGYYDLKLVKETFKIKHHYYAHNKDKYFGIECTGLYFELNSDKQRSQNLDEDELFEVEWVSRDVVDKEIIEPLHNKTFSYIINDSAITGNGVMINSEFLNGIDNKQDSIKKMIEHLEQNKIGRAKTNYKLQDWIFSRQRFWGEPIPMIHCDTCGWVKEKEENLPVLLPNVASYEPTDDGESPLANIEEFVNTTCPKCGKPAKRETDTMPNWAGSSWYYLRYMDPKNDKEFVSKEAMDYWGMVNYYNGGMEHATRHLLYARFWHNFLYDHGYVTYNEPFKKRVAHGMILGSNGEKMSKSKGNVVNPDDMVKEYGADALRTYEMFIGDYQSDAAWSEDGLKGCKKFLDRISRLSSKVIEGNEFSKETEILMNQTIKKVTEDLENMKYNTAVAALMILLNELDKLNNITKKDYYTLLILLNPIAPHITEELNQIHISSTLLTDSTWPIYDETKLTNNTYELVVQVNGKVRGKIEVSMETTKEEMEEYAKQIDNVKTNIEGKEIVKVIIVPKRLVNIVVK